MPKALDIYLERRKTRYYVGRLSQYKKNFVFEYDTAYLCSENPLSIGPDLPLKKARHTSLTLFPTFLDRIPSRQNPAYKEYCQSVGISPLEKDPFVLLGTLGKKSLITPFMCKPVWEQKSFLAKDLKLFRKNLGLSIREFSDLFDVSFSSIYRIENGKTTGKDTLKRIAIFAISPQNTLEKIRQNGHKINENKKKYIEHFFKIKRQKQHLAIGPFTVTPEDVQKCRPEQAMELLRKLLLLECTHFNIPQSSVDISSNISAKDGGQDALVKWKQEPARTNFFPKQYNCFQVKAKSISPAECKKEIIKTAQDVIKNNGAYILFSTHPVSGVYLQVREEAMQEAIEKAGYDLSSVEIKFYDANKIANWINCFPPLSVWFLKEVCGKSITPWISWQKWSKEDRDYRSEFMYHTELEKKKLSLYKHLFWPQKTAHLTGPSGVGKTRLALEVFRPPTDNTNLNQKGLRQELYQNDLSALALYSPARLITETNVRELKHTRAILIIDDCPLKEAEQFHRIVLQEDSHLSLLTIGQENPRGTFLNMPQNKGIPVQLEPDKEIVTKMLVEKQNINNIYMEPFYIKMTEGFPLMAQLLKNIGPIHLVKEELPNIRKKMLWGLENPDLKAEKAIKALALFDTICIEDEWDQEFVIFDTSIRRTKEELKYVAKYIAKIDYDEFYKQIKFFEERKIIQQYGRFIQVRPKPLALWLAMEFLQETPIESAIKWLSDMDEISKNLDRQKADSNKHQYQQLSEEEKKEYKKKQEFDKKRYENMSDQQKNEFEQWKKEHFPHQALRKAFCKQMSYLNQTTSTWQAEVEHQPLKETHPEIQKIAQQLCGPAGFFGQEKVLSTGWGAECLYYLTELAPEEVLSSLKKVIENKTIKELLYYPLNVPTSHLEEKKEINPSLVEKPLKAQCSRNYFGFNSVRRNWVAILQRLAFKKELYLDSAYLLLRLAEAENEDYSNNATGVWTSHFQLMLSGTQAEPKTKFQIIEEINQTGTIKQKEIAIQALKKALPQNGYQGIYNSSIIDSRQEWRPATYEESWEYFRQALKLLTQFATNKPLKTLTKSPNSKTAMAEESSGITNSSSKLLYPKEDVSNSHMDIQSQAQNIIAQYLPSLLKIKALHKDINKTVKQVMNFLLLGFWPLAIKNIESFLKYRSNRETAETIKKTKEILSMLQQPTKKDINQTARKPVNTGRVPPFEKGVALEVSSSCQENLNRDFSHTISIKTRIILYVKESNDYQIPDPKKPNKGYSPTFKELIDDFVTYMETTHNDITTVFESLFHGRQNNTVIFGREIAQSLYKNKNTMNLQQIDIQRGRNYESKETQKIITWVDKLLIYAKKWSKKPNFNPSFLCGFIGGLNKCMPEETQKILDKIAQSSDYKNLLLQVYYTLSLCDQDITRIINVLNKTDDLLWQLKGLSTAQKCQNVSTKKMKELIIFLTNKGGEGLFSALQIYSYYVHNNVEKKQALLPALFHLLTKKGLLTQKEAVKRDYTMDSHYYEKAVKDLFSRTEEQTKSNQSSLKKERILEKSPANNKVLELDSTNKSQIFAQFFVQTILKSNYSLYDFCIYDYSIRKIFSQIIQKYPNMVLSEIINTDQKRLRMPEIHTLFKRGGLLNTLGDEAIKKWCAKAPDKIPAFLAQHVDLMINNTDKNQTVWTDFAYFLFNTYGDREEVISAISMNLGSPGAMIRERFLNYLESVKQAMMSLQNHKHKNVRDFCYNQISYLQGRINQINQQEQERKELGLF